MSNARSTQGNIDMPATGREDILRLLADTGSPPSLIAHVTDVCDRAMRIVDQVEAAGIPVDRRVVHTGSLLHDMGIPFQTGEPVDVPELGDLAQGVLTDSLMHPILGFQVAERYGFSLAVRRCILCHTPGPTRAECVILGLTPPREEMLPVAMEEKIVMYADFVTWCAKLGLNPWRDERVTAEAGLLYFNIFWPRIVGVTLGPDGNIARRWIDAHREMRIFARPEWFGV